MSDESDSNPPMQFTADEIRFLAEIMSSSLPVALSGVGIAAAARSKILAAATAL